MNGGHFRHRNLVFVLVFGALLIGVHLGLASGLIAMSSWTGWTAYLVLALVVLAKVVLVILGRRHVRRRRAARAADENAAEPRQHEDST